MNDLAPYENFLGIGEGKRKARIEEEKRRTMQLEAELKLKTAGIDQAASAQAVEALKAKGISTRAAIIGAVLIVLILSAALYFIMKLRK